MLQVLKLVEIVIMDIDKIIVQNYHVTILHVTLYIISITCNRMIADTRIIMTIKIIFIALICNLKKLYKNSCALLKQDNRYLVEKAKNFEQLNLLSASKL